MTNGGRRGQTVLYSCMLTNNCPWVLNATAKGRKPLKAKVVRVDPTRTTPLSASYPSKRMRHFLRLPATLLACICVALISGAPFRAYADANPPEVCLVSGTIQDAPIFLRHLGEVLRALDGKTDAAALRAALGRKLGNPTFAGVNLRAPIRFYLLNPKAYPEPWIWQFNTTSADALKWALLQYNQRHETKFSFVRVDGPKATVAVSQSAAEAFLHWQQQKNLPEDATAQEHLSIEVNLPFAIRVYDEEWTRQLDAMRARMREALERRAPASKGGPTPEKGQTDRPARENEIRAAQAALEIAAAALLEVDRLAVALEAAEHSLKVKAQVTPLPGTALSAILKAHPPGDIALLRLCPPDADIVVAHNLSVGNAVPHLLLQVLGLVDAPSQDSMPLVPTGRALTALFLPMTHGGMLEILDIREGPPALALHRKWELMAQADATSPLIMKHLAAPNPQTQLRLAEVVPNEKILGEVVSAMFRRFFGSSAQAALLYRDGRTIVAVGPASAAGLTQARIAQVENLAGGKGDSIMSAAPFSVDMRSLPERPHLLIYASPAAVRGWFRLSGMRGPDIVPGEKGFFAAVHVEREEVRVVVRIPTALIKASAAPPDGRP